MNCRPKPFFFTLDLMGSSSEDDTLLALFVFFTLDLMGSSSEDETLLAFFVFFTLRLMDSSSEDSGWSAAVSGLARQVWLGSAAAWARPRLTSGLLGGDTAAGEPRPVSSWITSALRQRSRWSLISSSGGSCTLQLGQTMTLTSLATTSSFSEGETLQPLRCPSSKSEDTFEDSS